MKILLLNPLANIDDSSDYESIKPPYGLAIISAVLKRQGYNVTLWDAQAFQASRKKILDHIASIKPDIIGMGSFTFQLASVIALADDIKQLFPHITIVLGGPHVTAEPKSTLENHKSIDLLVIGEGELVMLELVHNLKNNIPIDNINGIAFRKDSNIVINSKRQFVQDLDSLPDADWSSLPMDRYWDAFSTRKRYGAVYASRGCPFSCTFCAASVTNGKKVRRRSPKNFVGELALLYNQFGIEEFVFNDSTFNVDNKWVTEICLEILKMKLPITWCSTVRADCLDEETLKIMKKAGCAKVLMGVETADESMLKSMKKGETLETILAGLSLLEKLDMPVDPSFIIGMPGETKETVDKTIALIKRISKNPKNLPGICLATPLPGTEFNRQAQKEGFIINDWSKFNSFSIAYVPESMTRKELEKAYRAALRKVYFTPSYLIRRLLQMTTFHQLKINLRYALRIVSRGFKISR